MKDPAFLFYSKDYYEGTRMMLPEERACYVDLLVYQHQNGYIPNDLKRISLYCSGISEATLQATLEAKFKLTHKGWVNYKLKNVMDEREKFSEKQALNGKVGQFWKKCKQLLSAKDYKSIREILENQTNDDIYEIIKDFSYNQKDIKATLQAMLEALLKQYAIANKDLYIDSNLRIKESNNTVNTPKEFYKNELQKSGDNPGYKMLIKYLFKENFYQRELKHVLSMKEQISWEQFSKLIEVQREYNVNTREILEEMENWLMSNTKAKNKTVLGTFRTFAKNRVNHK